MLDIKLPPSFQHTINLGYLLMEHIFKPHGRFTFGICKSAVLV